MALGPSLTTILGQPISTPVLVLLVPGAEEKEGNGGEEEESGGLD